MKSLLNLSGRLIPVICLLLILNGARAQSANVEKGEAGTAATVQYLGMQDDMIVFNVSYPNPDGNKFVITVKDQYGTALFTGAYNGKAFYKQFWLPKTDRDKIVFVFHNGKEADVAKTFEVNVNSRYVQDVAVRKL
jgi:hypothetical protein